MKQLAKLWEKGRVLDLWSIPHFLLGMLFVFLPYFSSYSSTQALFGMIGLALVWEVGEYAWGIKETIWNNIADVLLPIFSFIGFSKACEKAAFSQTQLTILFLAFLALYTFTNISGWLAYRRREREFMN